MKYYSEIDLSSILDIRDKRLIQMKFAPINIRFCRDCPYFISDYIPDEVGRYGGWCEYRSESEEGWHYDVMEDSFCNEDDIVDVYQFSFLFIFDMVCSL